MAKTRLTILESWGTQCMESLPTYIMDSEGAFTKQAGILAGPALYL